MFEQILTIVATFGALATSLYAVWQMRKFRDMMPSFEDVIWEENGEWHVREDISKLIDAFGSRFALSMRQSFFQAQGVDAKLSKNVDKAFSLDLMDSSGIGGVLDVLGFSNVKQMLAKNPRTLQMILSRVAPLLQNFGQGQTSDGGSDPRFKR